MSEYIEREKNTKKFTTDLLPEHHKYLTFLKKVFRHEFRKSWFRRISTDIIEEWVFRESAELWIMKSYINNECIEEIQPVYYYYMDHFLNNWKQEERIWWEIIWENDPILDAISIYITYTVLNKIWLKDSFKISINSTWIEKEKIKYSEEIQNFYENKKHMLSEESLILLENNPMLLLVSEREDEKILAKSAPSMVKFLKKDSKIHYFKFKGYLDILSIPYIEDHKIISENDYWTNSIWEFRSNNWDLIWKGSRRNTLWKKLWNKKDIMCSWFYNDTSVIIKMLLDKDIKIKNKDKIDLFFVQLWDEAKKVILPLSLKAREAWINTVVALWTPSMKEQMLKANRSDSKFVVMVWVMEARNWNFQVRNIESWTQEEVNKNNLIEYIIDKIGKDTLDFYCPSRDLIIE